MGTHPDLLVGVETHADVAVLDLGMVAEVAHRLHDLCHTRLVISTEERRAVGDDEVLTLVRQELRKLLRGRDDTR